MFLLIIKLFKVGVKQIQDHKEQRRGQLKLGEEENQLDYYHCHHSKKYSEEQHRTWYDSDSDHRHDDIKMSHVDAETDPIPPPVIPSVYLPPIMARRAAQIKQVVPPIWNKRSLNTVLRVVQVIMGLTVAGLYGVDLRAAGRVQKYADPKWVFAEIVAGMAVVTALLHLFSIWFLERAGDKQGITMKHSSHLPWLLWELFLCILWLTLFGIYGKMYMQENPEGQWGIVRMQSAVWVDLINLFLWVATANWAGMRLYGSVMAKRGQGVVMNRDIQVETGQVPTDLAPSTSSFSSLRPPPPPARRNQAHGQRRRLQSQRNQQGQQRQRPESQEMEHLEQQQEQGWQHEIRDRSQTSANAHENTSSRSSVSAKTAVTAGETHENTW